MKLSTHAVRTWTVMSCLVLGSMTIPSAGLATRGEVPCPDLDAIEIGRQQIWESRGVGDDSGFLAVSVARRGFVALQVEAMEPGSDDAWLDVMSSPCGLTSSAVEQSFGRVLLRVLEPGTLQIQVGRVRHQGPSADGRVRLASQWFPADFHKDGDPGDNTETDEDEPLPFGTPWANHSKDGDPGDNTETDEDEPLPFASPWDTAHCGCASSAGLANRSKDGDPGDNTETDEDEPLPFSSPGSECLAPIAGLPSKDGDPGDNTETDEDEPLPFTVPGGSGCCHAGEPANDLMVCARSLGIDTSIQSRLEHSWPEDRDYFTFELHEPEVVRIYTLGQTDTFGSLYDASGRRLSAADSGGEGENFGLEASLASGRYFVRVEGAVGGGGEYRLTIDR